jgi:cell division protein FtsB
MKQEVQQLSRKRDKLIRDIWELENNPEAVELKAREKLWLSDPDEIIIIKK